jgi:hypothetical protein
MVIVSKSLQMKRGFRESGDSADSVTALQNLAGLRALHGKFCCSGFCRFHFVFMLIGNRCFNYTLQGSENFDHLFPPQPCCGQECQTRMSARRLGCGFAALRTEP